MILCLQGGVDVVVKVMGSSYYIVDGMVNELVQVQQVLENIFGVVGMIVDQNQQIVVVVE